MKFIEIKCVLKHAAKLLMCAFILTVMTACGAKNADEAVSKEDENTNVGTEDVGENEKFFEEQIEELHSRFTYIEEPTMSVSQPGNYIIDGVELCDTVEASPEMNSAWEGYSEEELGFLSPDKMPNCKMNDEGIHFIVYNGVTYFYVNDLNNILLSYSSTWEYADVWIAADSDRILGGLEKYGRECAKKRDE